MRANEPNPGFAEGSSLAQSQSHMSQIQDSCHPQPTRYVRPAWFDCCISYMFLKTCHLLHLFNSKFGRVNGFFCIPTREDWVSPSSILSIVFVEYCLHQVLSPSSIVSIKYCHHQVSWVLSSLSIQSNRFLCPQRSVSRISDASLIRIRLMSVQQLLCICIHSYPACISIVLYLYFNIIYLVFSIVLYLRAMSLGGLVLHSFLMYFLYLDLYLFVFVSLLDVFVLYLYHFWMYFYLFWMYLSCIWEQCLLVARWCIRWHLWLMSPVQTICTYFVLVCASFVFVSLFQKTYLFVFVSLSFKSIFCIWICIFWYLYLFWNLFVFYLDVFYLFDCICISVECICISVDCICISVECICISVEFICISVECICIVFESNVRCCLLRHLWLMRPMQPTWRKPYNGKEAFER